MQKITPFLWFDHQAEAAARFYVSIFRNSGIVSVNRCRGESAKASGRPKGPVMTIGIALDGQHSRR
ncbi:MAG TPA: VOC family protein [Burkholderiales bacterium]|jgi:predicted 3-demethylubiquinone-9 3-methyltransferase (glyoxalase superfamily)